MYTHRGDLSITTCIECGRKHYELTLDPGRFGIKFFGPN
jgi:hypothetical protein